MTKLTTERLEQFIANPLGNSLYRTEQMDMARQLLAYEQAAKNPVVWMATDIENFPEYNSHNEFSAGCGAGTPLYAAPVLPKQPELVENLKKVMNSWLAMEPKLAFQPEFTDVMMLLDAEAAHAQPVIPEGLLQAINRLLDNDGSRGCFDALEQHRAKTELERLLASTAQPVSEPYKLEIDMDDADHFSITHLHEIIYGKELIWPEAKLLARFMLDVKQRVSAAKAQESE